MSATVQPVQRNRTLIDNEVQGGVLRKIAIHWILLFVCNSMALMIWLRLFEQPDANWQATFQETWTRFLPFFVVTCALIPAFVWDTLKLTHRFAGPISRLRSSLKDARDGKPIQPLKFRTNDYWREIADNFNAVVLPSSDAIAEAAAAQTPEDKTPAAESV
ncbi:MAG: hypothetical protein AAF989_02655 [Planctomycetota bacterium]